MDTTATVMFAICSLSAMIVWLLAVRGMQNTYIFGGPERVYPNLQKKLLILSGCTFVGGCVFTLV